MYAGFKVCGNFGPDGRGPNNSTTKYVIYRNQSNCYIIVIIIVPIQIIEIRMIITSSVVLA